MTQFQAMPQSGTPIVTPTGNASDPWYRFFLTLWRQVSSGTTTDITLQTVHSVATGAQQTADNAQNDVIAETQRAVAAEGNLQGQINTFNAQIVNLQGQITAQQGLINTLRTDVTNLQNTTNGLQTQINTINTRLANAAIP